VDPRPTPFDLAFGPIATERFPALASGIAAAGHDPPNRDAFVLVREVVELLRDLHDESAPGDAVAELVALCHASFLFWQDGTRVVSMDRDSLRALLADPPSAARRPEVETTFYLSLPPQRVWGEVTAGSAAEPLDGCFVSPAGDTLGIVAIFGLQAGRPGFTVVVASGPRRDRLARQDGTKLFSPLLEGGAAAGLFQVTGPEELLELCHRAVSLLPAAGPAEGRSTVTLA
jgi:hypothetical protein